MIAPSVATPARLIERGRENRELNRTLSGSHDQLLFKNLPTDCPDYSLRYLFVLTGERMPGRYDNDYFDENGERKVPTGPWAFGHWPSKDDRVPHLEIYVVGEEKRRKITFS